MVNLESPPPHQLLLEHTYFHSGKLCILCNSQILRKLSEISQIYMSWMTKKNISYVCIFMPLQYQVHKAKVVQVWSTLSFPISFINIRADICLAHTNYVFFALIQSLGSAWAKGGLASKLSELVLLPKLGALMHTRQPAHRTTSVINWKLFWKWGEEIMWNLAFLWESAGWTNWTRVESKQLLG